MGIGVEFTVHMCLAYLTSTGEPQERLVSSMEKMFVPVTHGGVSTLIGIFMLALSPYDFIVRFAVSALGILPSNGKTT